MDTGQSDAPADREQSAHGLDRGFWDERWSEVLRDHAAQVAQRPTNAYLTATVGSPSPGPVPSTLAVATGRRPSGCWARMAVTAVDFPAMVLGPRPVYSRNPRFDITDPSIGSRATLRFGRRTLASTTSYSACMSTWRLQWRKWCRDWRLGSRRAACCCWWGTSRSTQ